jgi:hypothetical protein
MNTKLAAVTLSAAITLAAVTARAGDVNLLGNLNVNSNLTAQAIGLGGQNRTKWPAASDGITNVTVDGSGFILDFSQPAQIICATESRNKNWAFVNHTPGRVVYLQLTQLSPGGFGNGWPSNVVWSGGSAPSSYGCPDTFSLLKFIDMGAYWIGHMEGMNYCASNCNYALQFTGANYVDITGYSDPSDVPFMVEFWINTTASNGYILGDRMDRGWDVAFINYSPVITFEYTVNGSYHSVNGNTTINDGNWHHITVSYDASENYDGTNYTIVVDGSLDGSSSGQPFDPGNGDLLLAAAPTDGYYNDFANSIVATLDDVSISSSSGTLASWTFDTQYGGNTVYDDSGHGHTGTLEGDPPPQWVLHDCLTPQTQGAGSNFSQGLNAASRAANVSNSLSTSVSVTSSGNIGTASSTLPLGQ